MAIVNFGNKVPINEDNTIPNENKVRASDLNQLKDLLNKTIQALGLDTDTWVANTSYSVGDLVVYQNKIYECATANNDSTFTPSKWSIVPILI